jgi:hypothetical protein
MTFPPVVFAAIALISGLVMLTDPYETRLGSTPLLSRRAQEPSFLGI